MSPLFFVKSKTAWELFVFSSISHAEQYIEVYDIDDGYDFLCDSLGRDYSIRRNPENPWEVQIFPSGSEISHVKELDANMRKNLKYLRSLGKWVGARNWLTEAKTEQLINEIGKFVVY